MPDSIEGLLAAEHRARPEEVRRLGVRELDQVRAIAVGEVESAHRVRALAILAEADADAAIPVLGRVLRDGAEGVAARTAAAAQLGRTGPGAEEPLLDALDQDDVTIVSSAIGSIARVGTTRGLERVAHLARRAADPVASQAAFAATLIAFRHRVPGYEPRAERYGEALRVSRAGRRRIQPAPLERPAVAVALDQLRAENYGVTLDARSAVGVDCAGQKLLVALDAEAARGRPAEVLAAGPLVAGLVGWQSPVDLSYSVRWLILTWQDEAGAQRLAVHRPSGQPFLVGFVEADGERARFELAAVRGRGNQPVEVAGSVAAGRVELTGVSSAERPDRGTPTPIDL